MSSLIYIDGQLCSFSEYIMLRESVEPKETEYGTDGKNKEWQHTPNEHHAYTFFSHTPEHHVCVNIQKHYGIMGFGVHKGKFSNNPEDYLNESRTNTSDSLKVFNKVAHVAIQGVKQHNMPHLRFNGADAKLNHTYDMITKNKFFNKSLEKHNMKYEGKLKNNHLFKNLEHK